MREKIYSFIVKNSPVRAKDLQILGIKNVMIHRHLKKLIEEEKIYKTGVPPHVFYFPNEVKNNKHSYNLDEKTKKIIEENYLIITPQGKKMNGVEGFIYWCEKQKLSIEKTAQEYMLVLQKYNAYKKNKLIDGSIKMQKSFPEVFLNEVFYLDFYSIERFGKTKLGQLLLYSKQSQNKKIIKEVLKKLEPAILSLIQEKNIQAIGFVSPTVKREVQLMNELKHNLDFHIPEIPITKIKTEIIVPQKTLNKLSDRIENAQSTFVIEKTKQYNNILLIDDAIGSGATLNEIAKKIKKQGIAKKVIGLALTGSFSGFDIISEI